MEAMRLLRQYIRKYWIGTLIIVFVIALMIFILLESLINGSGFNGYNQVTIAHTISGPSAGTVVRTEVSQPGKTLWDWLQLLIIPLALAFIAILFNRSERKNEQRITSDNQQETVLQEYIKEMSVFLIERNLRKSDWDAEVRKIARERTLKVLPRLDGKRKRKVLLFLYDADLIDKGSQIIDVTDADFSVADLSEISLYQPKWVRRSSDEREVGTMASADLSGVNLQNANLNGALLFRAKLGIEVEDLDAYSIENEVAWVNKRTITANLSKAKLVKADLSNAVLCGVDFQGADLSEANLDGANLISANLSGANLHAANLSIDSFIISDEDLKTASTWTGANLSGADLRGANLSEANLKQANLWQANLSKANLRGADLGGANLKDIKGITREKLEKQAKSLKGATMPDV